MGQRLTVFVGPKLALRRFKDLLPSLSAFTLMAGSDLFVLPMSEDVQDRLHTRYGTGEWLEFPGFTEQTSQLLVTSTDMTFAASASKGSALAYLQIEMIDGGGYQAAVAWLDGNLAFRPSVGHTRENRSRKIWPINGALRMLGVLAPYATAIDDECHAIGLDRYASNGEIEERAIAVVL